MSNAKSMSTETIMQYLLFFNAQEVVFTGECHDCKKSVEVKATVTDIESMEFVISGGAMWQKESDFIFKCPECYERDNVLHDQDCEVFARVCGYLRPVQQYNLGKKEEFNERKNYKVDGEGFSANVESSGISEKPAGG